MEPSDNRRLYNNTSADYVRARLMSVDSDVELKCCDAQTP